MISKTSMLKRVRGWDWKGVAAGLDEKPELIDFRDEKVATGSISAAWSSPSTRSGRSGTA